MAQPQTQVLTSLYGDLNRFGQNQEWERALKIANKILQESPAETAATHCKVVCLINLERFGDALNVINKDKSLHRELLFEKSYCEYRLNRTQEAITTLRSADTLDNRCKELLAQVLYRLEEYAECYELYKDLIKNSQDDFDEERETNLVAVLASLSMVGGHDVDEPAVHDNTYELCYNQSCYMIGQDDLPAAHSKLTQAEALCKESFADDPDIGEDEVEEELAIIRVQLAYILQAQGRVQEALAMYNHVQKHKPSSVGILAVLSNNVVAINKDQNVFDSKKKMKVATGSSLKHKLSSTQRRSIEFNQCLLHMYSNQAEQCHQLTAKLVEQYPDVDTPVLTQAAQHWKEKQLPRAIDVLEGYSRLHPAQSISVQLAIAQLHLAQGSVYAACDALKGLGALQYKPGVVSALVTLYMSQEDRDAAREVLAESVEWTRKHEPDSEALHTLMKAHTKFQLKHGTPQEAALLLEERRKNTPRDSRILAQLISAYSKFDPARAQAISRDLPSVDEIAKSVDVDALESAFSAIGSKYMKKVQKTEPSPGPSGDGSLLVQKKKKKRKTKLPKGYDPDVIPDAERWLPRKERSYYRGKRKDKKKDISKGPQGASVVIADLDASKSPSKTSPKPGATAAPPTPQQTAAQQLPQGPRQQKPTQAQKKKKKKGGGKW